MDHLEVITKPTFEPISLDEAKGYLRVSQDLEDAWITSAIKAARYYSELHLKQTIPATTYTWFIDSFPSNQGYFNRDIRAAGMGPAWLPGTQSAVITLPKPPLLSVTGVEYRDVQGQMQTLDPATYVVSLGMGTSLATANNSIWPPTAVAPLIDNVLITFRSGYATADDIPEPIKIACQMWVTHWYEQRLPVTGMTMTRVPDHVLALLDSCYHGTYS